MVIKIKFRIVIVFLIITLLGGTETGSRRWEVEDINRQTKSKIEKIPVS